jgi:hypothetical protein
VRRSPGCLNIFILQCVHAVVDRRLFQLRSLSGFKKADWRIFIKDYRGQEIGFLDLLSVVAERLRKLAGDNVPGLVNMANAARFWSAAAIPQSGSDAAFGIANPDGKPFQSAVAAALCQRSPRCFPLRRVVQEIDPIRARRHCEKNSMSGQAMNSTTLARNNPW